MVGKRLAIGIFLAALTSAPVARAGGGPQNVFLVVNASSWSSHAVANHFIALRKIPPLNVMYIPWSGGAETTEGEPFRQQILRPALEMIERRGLTPQIDYIVYSSDFPYAIELNKDFAGAGLPDQARPTISINSATYLWHFMLAKSPQLMGFRVNNYMRAAADRTVQDPSHGFRSWYGWSADGKLVEAGGQPYMLSTMLAMTSGRGNSVREAIHYLQRSATADGTRPKGTIYFSQTSDVRSEARAGQFELAVSELRKLGVAAQLISSVLPVRRPDVQGLTTGSAELAWASSGSAILPGAICENFTSYGGIMAEPASQTPLSEFLRFGAAGSSGTVVEPYAMAVKFPSPLVHVHYARGCTLAEAFYQSIHAPAQMLIVGDPLCRPWADIPQVKVSGVAEGQRVSGTVVLTPQAQTPAGAKIDRFELFVDGHRLGMCRTGGNIPWDSTADADGYHELRIVATEAGPIETQGSSIVPVTVDNHKQTATIATLPAKTVRWGESLKVRVEAPGMKEIYVIQNLRLLGKTAGPKGDVEIDPRSLGTGPVSMQAMGISAAGANEVSGRVWSAPIRLEVEPSRPLPPLANPPAKLSRGLVLQLPDKKVIPIQDTRDPAWLTLAGLRAGQPLLLQGFLTITAEDVYQFQISHTGDLKLSVDGHTLLDEKKGNGDQKFVVVSLAPGMHRVTLTGTVGPDAKLRVLFGGPGATNIDGRKFRHAR